MAEAKILLKPYNNRRVKDKPSSPVCFSLYFYTKNTPSVSPKSMLMLFSVATGINVVVATMFVTVGFTEIICHSQTECSSFSPFAD